MIDSRDRWYLSDDHGTGHRAGASILARRVRFPAEGRKHKKGAPVTHSPLPARRDPPPSIDTTRANAARIWNYWLGGKDNYPVDRLVGSQISAAMPEIVDAARAERGFLVRTVRHLVTDTGIYQFLDIGTGLPTANNTHEVAQASAPQCRIVYVNNDPLILAHARALLTSTPEGATDYVDADPRDPDKILPQAARALDFTQPIALMLLGTVEHVLDNNEAYALANRLMDALPSGSYLALCSLATEVRSEAINKVVHQWNKSVTPTIKARSRQELIRFFDRLELLEPGVVSASQWRPEAAEREAPVEVCKFSGVGRKL